MLRYFTDKESPNVEIADWLARIGTSCKLCGKNTINWKCVDCPELLCGDCKTIHERGKTTRNHHISAVNNLKEEILEHFVFNLECTSHYGVCTMYCVECNKCICVNCSTDNHSGHITYDIRELYKKKRKEIKKSQNDLESMFIPETQQQIDSIPAHIRAHEKNIEGLKLQLKNRAASLKLAVDECLENRYAELNLFSEDRSNKFSRHAVYLSQQMDKLNENQLKLIKLTQPNNTTDVTNLLTSSVTIPGTPAGTEIAHVEFLPGNLTENDIHREFGWFGFSKRFQRQQTFSVEGNTTTQISNRAQNAVKKTKDVVRTSVLKSGLGLKKLNTSLSSVTSICIFQDNTLWVGCTASRKIELINNSECARELPPLVTHVKGFCFAGKGDLFITDFDNCKVRRREYLSGKQTLFKKFESLRPVSVFSDLQDNHTMIYVGLQTVADRYESGKGSVQKMSLEGKVMHTFGNGRPIYFTVPNRITVDVFSKSLLVIDSLSSCSGRIISISEDRTIQFTYNSNQNNTLNLFNPTDLVCTLNGQILICDGGNDLLHVLDTNGLLDHYIDTKSCGIERPLSLALYGDHTLYVGTFTYKDGKVSKKTQKGVVYIVTDFDINQ